MEVACNCNWDIPGVERLPPHDHNAERTAADLVAMNPGNPRVEAVIATMTLRDGVHIWVDWKAMARPSTEGNQE